jgi:hypothetical protein
VPTYFNQFDWIFGFSWGWHKINETSKYIYTSRPFDDTFNFIMDSAMDLSSSIIVFASEDTTASFFDKEKILKLLSRCSEILWEAKNV